MNENPKPPTFAELMQSLSPAQKLDIGSKVLMRRHMSRSKYAPDSGSPAWRRKMKRESVST